MVKPKVDIIGTQWTGSCSVDYLVTYKGQLKIMLSSKEEKFSNIEFIVNQLDYPSIVEMCTYAISSKTEVWVLVSDIKQGSNLVGFYIYPS